MPCGGGDIGLNVWVEEGDLLFYIARSGAFDESNTLLKQGRIRIRFSPNPLRGTSFRQELRTGEGCILLTACNGNAATDIRIWVDVFHPVIRVETTNNRPLQATVFYENWRYEDRLLLKNESQQNSYKWAPPEGLMMKHDEVGFDGDRRILFYHRNEGPTVFDVAIQQQGLDSVKSQLFNPLHHLTFGGWLEATGFYAAGTAEGVYGTMPYRAWLLETRRPLKKWSLNIRLYSGQTATLAEWKAAAHSLPPVDRQRTLDWWRAFWERSFIHVDTGDSLGFEISRNYHLFRYQLACNLSGDYPTRFNGGLFTFDAGRVDSTFRFGPDYRKWGGGTYTAQNQRLVYFPMLKAGDFDLITPQLEFYRRLLSNAELRSQVYWQHRGACYTEQMENFGLPNPAEYGWKRPADVDPGLEYNAWLEYQWDTVLEFCFLALERESYTGEDQGRYLPWIESSLRFFDEHYQYLARKRGIRPLDADGRLILYPSSGAETYKMAYNATSTVAALHTLVRRLKERAERTGDSLQLCYYRDWTGRLPEIRTRTIGAYTTIAPAWLWERINNTESPQLYPVFPWGMYGVNRPDLDIARNTYLYDPEVVRFRGFVGWKQDAIWAARLGLTEEAKSLVVQKFKSAAHRFPTFWGPGYDWTPDHNQGGSAMIALQEMLLQTDEASAILLPAWPPEWNVHFKLHAPKSTVIECRYINGKIESFTTNNNTLNTIVWNTENLVKQE
jgi:hypothetical protein